MRPIDADALIKDTWFVLVKGENIDDIAEQIIRQCKQIVKDAPSIDIEPKHGEWIDRGMRVPSSWVKKCSLCGHETDTWRWCKFCPNCGAKMVNGEGGE